MNKDCLFCFNSQFYLVDSFASNLETNITKKQIDRIQDLLGSTIPCLDKIEQVKIKPGSIKVKIDESWERVDLNENELKIIKKIVKKDQKIVLTHDVFNELVTAKIASTKIPSFYLFSSGGGGHKSAKDARLEADWSNLYKEVLLEFQNQYPGCEDPRLKNPATFIRFCKEFGLVQEYDVLHDFLGRIGHGCSSVWNKAQETGNVKKQERLAGQQWIFDTIFAIPVFFATLKRLKVHGPSTIVSTQAMATPSILMAIHIYNKFYKSEHAEEVKLDLYLTDMPTQYASHFFSSLKRIHSWGGKDKLTLFAPKPINETDWSVLCQLDNDQVVELETRELPVRPAFLQAAENFVPLENPRIQIKLSCEAEGELLKQVLLRQNVDTPMPEFAGANVASHLTYEMQAEDEGYFLMLGSKPTKQAIKDYVDRFVELANDNPGTKYHLFAFAGQYSDDPTQSCFYRELCEYVKDIQGLPTNLAVVPLSFQDPAQLVSLMLQCHTITRSGGSTVMELLVLETLREHLDLPEKKRLVHAQFVKKRANLAERIPVWERGNYFFLQEALGKSRVQATDPFHFEQEEVEELYLDRHYPLMHDFVRV